MPTVSQVPSGNVVLGRLGEHGNAPVDGGWAVWRWRATGRGGGGRRREDEEEKEDACGLIFMGLQTMDPISIIFGEGDV